MDLRAAGTRDNIGEGKTIDPSPWQDLDTPSRLLNIASDVSGPIIGTRLLPRGQHPRHTHRNQLLQRLCRVGHDVESAMKDSLLPIDQVEKATAPGYIERTICVEDPEGNTISPVFEGEAGIAKHHGEVGGAIAEAARTRTNHDDDRNIDGGFGFEQGAERGRQAPQRERTIEFDAVRPTLLCSDAIFDRRRTYL